MTIDKAIEVFDPDNGILHSAEETEEAMRLAVTALELMKGQEPLKPVNPLSPHGSGIYFCGKCMSLVGTHDKFCSQCGRAVKWDD